MSLTNLLIVLNTYSDPRSSNSPDLNNFKWTREIDLIPASNTISQNLTLAASGSQTVFTGSAIKKMVYIEANKHVSLTINGSASGDIKPIIIGTSVYPGIRLETRDITSLVVTNMDSVDSANIFVAAIE
jgi:hypothetical protein